MSSLPKIAHALLHSRWVRGIGLALAVGVSLWSFDRIPHASWLPALLGLVPWAVGKYVLCPLRWHALSLSGRPRRWHLRVYAEAELLGLVSPGHAGADLWRLHKLHETGMERPSAVAEVGLDRLVGAIGLTFFVLVAGASLPPQLLLAAVGIAAAVLVAALVVRRVRPHLLPRRPLPRPSVVVTGVLLSLAYQLTIMCLLMGTVDAVGHDVDPLRLLAVFGASQVAGIIPGIQGASPRDGALVVGLTSLGLPWSAAFGAVALTALLAWLPALLLGGGSFAARRLRARGVLRPLKTA
ncbi:MAG: lysylphosphatidylglycerol synthase domain-containing protein [Nocardioidaceae bacterium]